MSKISIEDLEYSYIEEIGIVYEKVNDAVKNNKTIISCITVDKEVEDVTLEDYMTMFSEVDGLTDDITLEVANKPTDVPFSITGRQLKHCLTLLYHTWLVAEDCIKNPNRVHLELGIDTLREILESTGELKTENNPDCTSHFN